MQKRWKHERMDIRHENKELKKKHLKTNVTGQVPLVYTVSCLCFPHGKFELLFYSHHCSGAQCGMVAGGVGSEVRMPGFSSFCE